MVCCLLRVVLIHAVCTLIVRMRIPVPGPRMRPKTANGTRPGLSRVLLSLRLVVLNVLQPEPEDRRHPEASGGSRASSSWQDCPQSMVLLFAACRLDSCVMHGYRSNKDPNAGNQSDAKDGKRKAWAVSDSEDDQEMRKEGKREGGGQREQIGSVIVTAASRVLIGGL